MNAQLNEGQEEFGEEDVPEDFFDDFSNNDFLAGLDVVDAWEDGPPGKPSVTPSEASEGKCVSEELELESVPPRKSVKERLGERVLKLNTKTDRKSEEVKKSSEDKVVGKLRTSTGDCNKERFRSGSMENPDKRLIRQRRSKSREYNGRSLRRSRSRNRHSSPRRITSRNRRSKSVDKKEPSDSRRDPNKTKRDIQRDKVKCAKDKEAKIISEKLRVVETGLVPPGTEMECDIESVIEKPMRKRTRSRSLELYRWNRYSEKSPSPKIKRRYRSPSPAVRRAISPVSRSRFYRRSPTSSAARDRSFEREHNKRARRSSSRKRDRRPSNHSSPVRKKPSFLDELDEKLNVQATYHKLEQIKEKINGGPSQYTPCPVPCPNPSPVNQPFQQGVYDEQFFIGPPNPDYILHPMLPQQQQFPSRPPPPQLYNNTVVQLASEPPPKSVESLFNDENISLSAFLAITARVPDESKTLDMQTKLNVITRCQDAIKIMTEHTKPSGRFYHKGSTKEPEKTVNFTNVSPMKRNLPVRLNFTKRMRNTEEQPTAPLAQLLHKLGLKQPPGVAPHPVANTHQPESNSQLTQTDCFTCEECESRKKVKSVSVGVQSVGKTTDFSCQVSEESFLNTARSALKNIIKTQSLAALTPAQILSQLGDKELKQSEVVRRNASLQAYNSQQVPAQAGYPRGAQQFSLQNEGFPAYQQIGSRPPKQFHRY